MAERAFRRARLGQAAPLVVALALAGCGGKSELEKRREAVDAYVRGEQTVLQRAQPGFRRANEAYVAYAQGRLAPGEVGRRMREAERTIRDARDGVAELDPPADARALHERVMRYLDLNVGLARETRVLAAYVPAAERAVGPLPRVNRRLESRLAAAGDSGDQSRALRRFSAAIAAIARDLRDLDVPPVLAPAHDDQVRRLAATRRLGDRLRRALVAQDAERVARLLRRFRSAASGGGGADRLTDRALGAYARRLRGLTRAQAAVQREQERLQARLR